MYDTTRNVWDKHLLYLDLVRDDELPAGLAGTEGPFRGVDRVDRGLDILFLQTRHI